MGVTLSVSKEGSKKVTTEEQIYYQLVIDHLDVIGMMNDPDVYFEGGTVAEDTVIELVVKQQNGSETD